jgi:hypothetical protein
MRGDLRFLVERIGRRARNLTADEREIPVGPDEAAKGVPDEIGKAAGVLDRRCLGVFPTATSDREIRRVRSARARRSGRAGTGRRAARAIAADRRARQPWLSHRGDDVCRRTGELHLRQIEERRLARSHKLPPELEQLEHSRLM